MIHRERPTPKELVVLEEVGLSLMRELAPIGKQFFYNDVEREEKSDGSLVSAADRELEKKARDYLEAQTPHYGFLGEEFGRLKALVNNRHSLESKIRQRARSESNKGGDLLSFEVDLNEPVEDILNLNEDTYWVFDPIDGTINFLARSPLWTQLLALVVGGKPVLGIVSLPMVDEVFIASEGNGARFGKLFGAKSELRPCFTRRTKELARAHLSVSSPQYFAHRGIESWYTSLLARRGDLRTHSDAYGFTRILCGGIDAQIEPMALPHDIAALQILFDETPHATLVSLQGHKGDARFQRGSIVGAASEELSTDILNSYYEHLHHNLPKISEHISPQDFSQRFLLPHMQTPFSDRPNETRQWARAMETAVAMFSRVYPNLLVEDVSCIASATDAVSVKIKNGKVDAPPRRKESVGLSIRAVVAGGTGQVVTTLPEGESKVSLIYRALELAAEQSRLGKHKASDEILAYRDHVHGHLGPMAWGQKIGLETFPIIVENIARHQRERLAEPVQNIETGLSLSTENRIQIFLDGSQHTLSTNVTQLSSIVTTSRGSEKRRMATRVLENRELTVDELDSLHLQALKTTESQAIEMLDAQYAPENVEYDYLAIDADLMGLILHEAIGHAAEGDLIATGQSGFGRDGVMQNVEVGPDWMNIAIDGNLNNCGYSFIDAEGTLARRKWLVRSGKLVDAIHSRETAKLARSVPDGCARIESVYHPAINRMTSIWVQAASLLPFSKSAKVEDPSQISPRALQVTLEESGYLKDGKTVLYLSGWKGGTATCSNLEFRADVKRLFVLKKGQEPKLLREANFTGIATECFKSAVAAFGPVLCRTIGICGKDGQGVPTSDGGPAIMLMTQNSKVRVIGSGEAQQ